MGDHFQTLETIEEEFKNKGVSTYFNGSKVRVTLQDDKDGCHHVFIYVYNEGDKISFAYRLSYGEDNKPNDILQEIRLYNAVIDFLRTSGTLMVTSASELDYGKVEFYTGNVELCNPQKPKRVADFVHHLALDINIILRKANEYKEIKRRLWP